MHKLHVGELIELTILDITPITKIDNIELEVGKRMMDHINTGNLYKPLEVMYYKQNFYLTSSLEEYLLICLLGITNIICEVVALDEELINEDKLLGFDDVMNFLHYRDYLMKSKMVENEVADGREFMENTMSPWLNMDI